MIIRDCSTEDAPAIAGIWNPLIRSSVATFNSVEKSAEDIAQDIVARQAAGLAYLVADIDVQVVGFATYGQFRGGIGYAHTMEHTIYLGDTAQGHGVGRALLGALEDHARAANVHSFIAGICAKNETGIGFHRALGYREVATLPEVGHKFGRWFDLALMQKIL